LHPITRLQKTAPKQGTILTPDLTEVHHSHLNSSEQSSPVTHLRMLLLLLLGR